jgi:hypothetical protein
MSLTGQVLVLVLIFPAVGLLLGVLAVLERWVSSELPRSKPYGRAVRARGRVLRRAWPAGSRAAGRRGQRAAPSAGQAERPGRSAAA